MLMGISPQSTLDAIQALADSLQPEASSLQWLFEAFPVGIAIHQPGGTVDYLNDSAKTLLGMEEDVALGQLDLSHWVSYCGFRRRHTNEPYPIEDLPVFQALQGNATSVEDIEVVNGAICRMLLSKAFPVRNAGGSIAWVVVAYQDITAQVQHTNIVNYYTELFGEQLRQQPPTLDQQTLVRQWLETDLHHHQLRLQRFAETVPGVMYSLRVNPDRSMTCEYVNEQVETVFEATHQEIRQHPERYFLSQICPGDRWGLLRGAARSAAKQTVFTYGWQNIAPSGRIRWLKTRAQAEYREHGVICWHGVLWDVSDRQSAKFDLHQQAAESAAVLQAIPDLIVRVDHEGYYLNCIRSNPAIDILPHDVDVRGRHLADFLPDTIVEAQLAMIRQALVNGEIQVAEQVLVVNGKSQYEEVRAVPCGEQDVILIIRDISDRKAASLACRASEARHRRLITALPDLMFRVSRAGYWLGYVHTNAVIDCLPNDYDPGGHHITDHMPPAIAQQQLQKIEQAIVTGEMQVFEQTLSLEERVQHEEVRIVPQGPDEVLFIVRDITDRKTAELALKKSEAENRAILSALPDLMVRLHRDGTLLGYFRAENMVDLLAGAGDIIGRSIFEFTHNDFYRHHIEAQMQAVRQVLDSGAMAIYEQKIPTESGWQHEEVRIVPTGEDEVLLIVQDINERKQTQIALQQSEAQKQAILKAIPDLMFLLRADGMILDYMGTAAFADLLGNSDNWVGKNLLDFGVTEALAAHFEKEMAFAQRALTTGQMQVYEQETCIGDITQQEEVRIVPVTQGEVLIMIRDISDRKRIEAELRTANERLAKLSLTDSLTMLANRRRLDEYLEQEWQRSCRRHDPLSFILLDLDFFKRFNDTYGHQQGDECLYEVAQAALGIVNRSSDLMARYGGEEFAVVLSNTDLKGAFTIAQRICQVIRALQIPHSSSEVEAVVTASLGVSAIIPTAGQKPNVLIRQADQALYAAKQAGRNNCQCFISC